MDTVDRLPQAGAKRVALRQRLREELNEHRQYVRLHGERMAKIRNWTYAT